MTQAMEFARDAKDLARYAAIFAADAGTDALYLNYERSTDVMAELCLMVAEEALRRRDAADAAGEDFYACAFVEQAAQVLRETPTASLGKLFYAGQLESDSIAGKAA